MQNLDIYNTSLYASYSQYQGTNYEVNIIFNVKVFSFLFNKNDI